MDRRSLDLAGIGCVCFTLHFVVGCKKTVGWRGEQNSKDGFSGEAQTTRRRSIAMIDGVDGINRGAVVNKSKWTRPRLEADR